jgi:YHS domain-containing protein
MMRFLILILIGYLVYRMVRGKVAPEIVEKESPATETFQDPVCGVYLSEADAVVGNLEGKRYHFCSMGCLQEFEKSLQRR